MLDGREFTDSDAGASSAVAIVNDTFARTYFENKNALGRHFNFTGDKAKGQIEIIGIVKTVFDAHHLTDLCRPFSF